MRPCHAKLKGLCVVCVLSIALLVLLFSVQIAQTSGGNVGFALREITAVINDSSTQWVVLLFLSVYFVAALWLCSKAYRANNIKTRPTNPYWWPACLLGLGVVSFLVNNALSSHALVLIAGAVIGFLCGYYGKNAGTAQSGWCMPVIFIIIYYIASLYYSETNHRFVYRGQPRWTGPWDNPNIYGLFMGTGISLLLGGWIANYHFIKNIGCKDSMRALGSTACQFKESRCRYNIKVIISLMIFIVAAFPMGRGLLNSYSRGAWLATACGVAFLCGHRLRMEQSMRGERTDAMPEDWLRRNCKPLFAILFAMMIILIWNIDKSERVHVRRAVSIANKDDFSWRNRVASWEGAMQIASERPWFGAGWSQPELLYKYYYCQARINDSGALPLNDYLMLADTLGVPALFCFGMYLWMSIRRQVEIGKQKVEITGPSFQSIWLQTTCHAGAIVLLVGFWFDGGLFQLPTAATFWILLELGGVGSGTTDNTDYSEKNHSNEACI